MYLETLPNQKQKKQTAPQAAQKDLWQAIKTVISWQNQAPPLVTVPRNNSLPLSFAQERLWFRQQIEPNRALAYHIPLGLKISGQLNQSALEQSLQEICQRHEVLRTSLELVEGKPAQIIHPQANFALSKVDLQSYPQQDKEARVRKLISQDIAQSFDLTQAPLLRGTLFKLEDAEYILLLTVHHLAIDAWSKGVLFQELTTLYEAYAQGKPSSLPELSIQYADYALWQRQWLNGEFKTVLKHYWQNQLGDSLPSLQLPCDRPKPEVATYNSGYYKKILPPQLTQALKTLSRREGVTLFATLLAAFKVLLYRYTEQNDIFVCSPIANRNRKEIKGLIGYFVNLLILRTKFDRNYSFRQLLSEVRQVASGGYAHQDLPVQQVVNALNSSSTPLSQVMFALQNTAIHTLELSGLKVENIDLDSGKADFDLYLHLIKEGDTLAAVFKYNSDLWLQESIVKMMEHYQTILENLVANLDCTLDALLPLTASEQQQLRTKREENLRDLSEKATTYVAPRNPLELKLTQIWSEVLGIDSIGIEDNFFVLGGQSLLAISLFNKIEQEFNQTLPLNILFQAPTIEKLAAILQDSTELPSHSSLIPIQPHGTKPPFFCIHGQQGNVLNLRKLSHYLGSDQPFYGLQAQGLDGQARPSGSIADMARKYIQAIRTIQPHGPYFLGGNSMGGTIALEMAQQLQQAGEEVALLAMFDSFNKNAFPRLMVRQQNYLAYLFHQGLSKSFVMEIKELAERKGQQLLACLYSSLERHLPHKLAISLVAEANMQAKWGYEPKPFSGKITLFRAQEPATFNKQYLPTRQDWFDRDLQNGWGDLAELGLEIHSVPGDHYSIFDEPHVSVLATELKACLAKTQCI